MIFFISSRFKSVTVALFKENLFSIFFFIVSPYERFFSRLHYNTPGPLPQPGRGRDQINLAFGRLVLFDLLLDSAPLFTEDAAETSQDMVLHDPRPLEIPEKTPHILFINR